MRIAVLGGGFAGIAAAKKLDRLLGNRKDTEIVLIDKNEYTTMFPSLPDAAGKGMERRYLIGSIRKLIPKRVVFKKLDVQKISFPEKKIYAEQETVTYDYLIYASGSKTNFYGFNENLDKIYKLDSLEESDRIRTDFVKALESGKNMNLVVCGAGFTGIELACCLKRLARQYYREVPVILVEKAERILASIPEKMVKEVEKETGRLGFKIIRNDSVIGFDGNTLTLRKYGTIPDAFFCWCSGVMASVPAEGTHKKLFDERILVDEFLRVPDYPEVYAVGDSAAFMHKGAYLRRAVNYADMMGKLAAVNIAGTILGKPLKPFKPFDPGWVIPVNATSIGEAFGIGIKGRLGILMHYIICGVKNYSFRNFMKYFLSSFKFAAMKK